MRTGLASASVSVRDSGGLERVDRALRRFEDDWRDGVPSLESYREECRRDGTVSVFAALVKADLRRRHARGERPRAADYLERFPELAGLGERFLSLAYEEFCLLEEHGEAPDASEFCAGYGAWRDSLSRQLQCHRMISQAAGPAPAPAFPEPGDLFAHFRITRELGRGGAGRVYLALDESLGGREVALKVSADRGAEPAIMARLEHRHIMPVHSVTPRPGSKVRGLCMPYRPGLPLDEVIRRLRSAGRPGRARALRDALGAAPARAADAPTGWDGFPARGSFADGVAWVVSTVADALAHAHAQHVYHRDVKPANVLLTVRDGPQLLDFNLSHDPHSPGQAEAALRGGTLPYMAPEQLAAFLDAAKWEGVKGAADLYSLGLLARELLTGLAPDTPDPALSLPRAIHDLLDRRADFDPGLRRADPSVPHALEAVIGKCLAYDPNDRYPDAAALAEDLRRYLARRPLRYARNRSPRERAANRLRRHRVAVAAGITALVVLSGVAARQLRPLPVEERPVLQHAVKMFGEAVYEDALRDLAPLAREAPGSPVVGLLYAAALALTGHPDEADAALEAVWARPGAEDELIAWGRDHKTLAVQAENLASALLQPAALAAIDPARKPTLEPRLVRAFHLALLLDPGREKSRAGLAVLDERRGDYEQAYRALSGLIAGAHTDTSRGKGLLATFLQYRARVALGLAGKLTESGRASAGTGGPVERLTEALRDLDRAASLFGRNEPRRAWFDLNYLRCEVVLALAAAEGAGPGAEGWLREARALLGPLADHDLDQAPNYKDIAARVRAASGGLVAKARTGDGVKPR